MMIVTKVRTQMTKREKGNSRSTSKRMEDKSTCKRRDRMDKRKVGNSRCKKRLKTRKKGTSSRCKRRKRLRRKRRTTSHCSGAIVVVDVDLPFVDLLFVAMQSSTSAS
jgi:hypothetical protein